MPLAEDEEEESESAWSVLVAVAVAALGAFFVRADFCHHRTQCLEAGTCVRVGGESSCAFVTTTTAPGQKMLNATVAGVLRGVCKPGLRQVTSVSGAVECRHIVRYPEAMELEIADFSTNASDHQRWCGRWIDAGVELERQRFWAFEEAEAVAQEVESAIDRRSVPVNDVKKFLRACNAMVTSNSQGAEATAAYALIASALEAVDATTATGALEAVGVLSSFFCDAPARLGVGYDGNGYVARLRAGTFPDPALIKSSMYAVGLNSFEREAMDAFARLVVHDGGAISEAQAAAVVRGSVAGTWVETQLSTVFSATYEPNAPLARFIDAAARQDPTPYLKGLAATCALATREAVEGDLGDLAPLGRLRGRANFPVVTTDELFEASSPTWSAAALESATRRTARSSCASAAKFAFADARDREVFKHLVTQRLYDRLEGLVAAMRAGTTLTLDDPLIGSIFSTDEERTLAVAAAFSTSMRVAGAPPKSWGGTTHEFQRPTLDSKDGALLILTKQARAIFLDRMGRVAREEDVCTHPPLMPPTEKNAYLLISNTFSCAMLMPGILTQPFADERYDDASLYSRIGFIVAHEFAHVTANRRWNSAYATKLLYLYNENVYVEAIADLAAVATVMSTNKTSGAELCGHVSQIWCGRVGWNSVPATSHPAVNFRGDALCSFLRLHF